MPISRWPKSPWLTVRTKGGGCKKRYRSVLFNQVAEEGYVESFGTVHIEVLGLLIFMILKLKHVYVLALKGLRLGDFIASVQE